MCKKQGGTLPYALLILLQSVLYGFGNPLSKIGFESITVLWCLGIRFSGAAALIFDDVAVLPQGTVCWKWPAAKRTGRGCAPICACWSGRAGH